ncbi:MULTISPECIES: DegQ family serine endoprotease [Thioclava]|uniref:DegQ family serine endoprotease n=1 Tax=Thioclava TaxID=285107 RepID=UPI0009964D7F|nr:MULTISPECIES: DegQ family serine endoprotease [Thioclava]MAQ37620.1 serine protease [Thioclava sp.]MPQ92328.1 DegQ family serine endoprotease [Thioclava sp. JE_KL1]OOY06446.1 serine protease [Thioclava sp. F28-4]OOY17917.1 serine protease [Thioclava sp. DLFJ4-1]
MTILTGPGSMLRAGLSAATLAVALACAPLAGPAYARAAPESFAELVDQVSNSVVNITTSTTVAAPTGDMPNFPPGSPFEDLFRDFGLPNPNAPNGPNGRGAPRRSNALGSGFVISEDGYIVTNNHVIEDADEIEIEFFSGKRLDAKLVGTDPKTDIALLKVESDSPLPFVAFGDSDAVRVGDWVMAMGNPLGQGFSASAGIISARNRELSGSYDDYLQTDAAINRGNSGGPLFDMEGEVVGVNTAILSPNGGSIGIGFSMASNVVAKVVEQLKEYGETRRGWLGVKIQDVTADMAEAMGLEAPEGALVSEVPDGPAKEAGIEAGDVITSFDGGEVKSTRDLVRRVADAPVGEKVRVTVMRDGEAKTLLVTLGRREAAEGEQPPKAVQAPQEVEKDMLGLTVTPLTDDLRTEMGLTKEANGLVIKQIDETSSAYEKGLRVGDLITEVGQKPVSAVDDFEERVQAAKDAGRKSILLLIRRAGEPRFVALPVE